ncbi:MAG: hypothetical protein ABGY96_24100 [bacterium]|nr:hypothetical protein [Gammaproteobacteria bacterium]HIL97836.1 hypothetical protein [Pseudomonadales bacterium]
MNWEALGAITGSLGLVVVVISLIYVSFQMRQTNRIAKAARELEAGRMWTDFLAKTAHSNDMADIWDKGHDKQDELTPSEKRRLYG